MITIGLTGGIGSGKSFVAQRFAAMGVPCYDCDSRAKQLNDTNPQIISAITGRYGSQAYNDGKLDRRFLAARIFADKAELQWIDNLVHPIVRADFAAWRDSQTVDIVVVESAILFEGGLRDMCSAVVAVVAPMEVRISRVMNRDSATREQVAQRIANQHDDAYFRAHADYVIVNDGSADIDIEIKKIIENQINAKA